MRCRLTVYFPPKWQHRNPYGAGARVTSPVTLNDLIPTVLSIVGLTPPDHVHGTALFGPHRGPEQRYAVGSRDRMDERFDLIRSITETRFRYIRNYNPHRPWGQYIEFLMQAGAYQDWMAAHMAGTLNPVQDRFWGEKPYEELYDLHSDPHPIANLIDNPAHRARANELRAALDAHMVAINDNGLIPEGSLLEGYVSSRQPGAYPLAEAMQAEATASRRGTVEQFLAGMGHISEVVRYWAATGLLIAGEAALPQAMSGPAVTPGGLRNIGHHRLMCRRARLIEYDPLYCDTIFRRWQAFSGKQARLAATGDLSDDVADHRLGPDLELAPALAGSGR